MFVNVWVAADHDTRPMAGSLFAARNAYAEEFDILFVEKLFAAFGVFEVRVAAVYHQIARFEMRYQFSYDGIDDGARGDEQHYPARCVEPCYESGDVFCG